MGERKDYGYGQSRYLRADEMVGKVMRVCIASVEDIEFDDKGPKPVLNFVGQDKSLVVNSTNFDVLAAGINNNSNNWVGHSILLRGEKIRFRGRLVDSIRVAMPPQASKAAGAKQQAPADFEVPWDDEIPDLGPAA